MFKRHGVLAMLAMLLYARIMPDEGGSDEGEGDIGSFEIGDEPQAPTLNTDAVSVPKEEWEGIQQTVAEVQREKFFKETVEGIKKDIPGFDHTKVVEKLKEIHAKDPERAEQYNTPLGFKLLWHEMHHGVAQNDPVNGGSGKGGGGGDFHSLLDGAMQGKEGALRKAISMAL